MCDGTKTEEREEEERTRKSKTDRYGYWYHFPNKWQSDEINLKGIYLEGSDYISHFLANSVIVAHTRVFKPHIVEMEQERRRENEGRRGGVGEGGLL